MSSAFPNEPNGFVSTTDWSCSGSLHPSMYNVYNTQAYATDATAPLSPPQVFDDFMEVGSTTGNGQWGGNLPSAPPPTRSVCGVVVPYQYRLSGKQQQQQ